MRRSGVTQLDSAGALTGIPLKFRAFALTGSCFGWRSALESKHMWHKQRMTFRQSESLDANPQ